jgi:hypothetical protein
MTSAPATPTATAFLPRRKLPIGIQTFSEIIQEGHYYIDKSSFAVRLANEGKYFFLRRPRRFGKSLFLDTLREMFEGNQALMFQSGYLTIDKVWQAPGQMELTPKYPNLEVQAALNNSLLQSLTGGPSVPEPQISWLYDCKASRNIVGFEVETLQVK